MKISARNVFDGTVKSISRGVVNAEVVIAVEGGVEIVSMLPIEAIDRLGFDVGDAAYAVVNATDVMVGLPHHKRGEDE